MQKVTLIPGDGIGPEIVDSVKNIFKAASAQIDWTEEDAGLGALAAKGKALPDELVDSLNTTRLGLKGPTTTPVGGGHRSINVEMRQKFDLFANVRPVKTIPGVKSNYKDLDMVIVRENTEDLYKGIEYMVGKDTAHGIKLITRAGSTRIARHAFELARKEGRKKVSVIHKANIMKLTDGLFLDSCRDVSKNYSEIEYEEVIIDNMCMQMVLNPHQFDVILTENLYGDILSDLGSALIGGLGLASGANHGVDMSIFEAVHGSAPDIAGKNLANPSALLFSGISLLEHINQPRVATNIKNALNRALSSEDTRTKDLGGPLGTSDFTNAVIENLIG
jgi:isocitrate dehydrogenase (NAD+)